MKFSITRKIQMGMLAFGLLMGAVFPFYARFFTTYKEGMQWYFDLGCLMAGAMIGVISFLLVKKFVLSEIKKVAEALEKVNRGDLSVQIPLESQDDLGALVRSFNELTQHFQQIIQEIHHILSQSGKMTQSLLNHSDLISKMTHAVSDESQEVLSNTKNCSLQVKETESKSQMIHSHLREVQTSMTEVSQSLDDICTRSLTKARLSDSASEDMQMVTQTIHDLANSIEQINQSVTSIQEISDKTNLLALNATIEAASAGDAGKGFGVVANEVKALSHQTKEAVQDIYQKMEQVKHELENSISQIHNVSGTNQELKESSLGVLQLLESQKEVLQSAHQQVDESTLYSQEISKASEGATHNINEATQLLGQLTSQISTTSHDIDDVEAEVNSLSVLLKRLSDKSQFFKY